MGYRVEGGRFRSQLRHVCQKIEESEALKPKPAQVLKRRVDGSGFRVAPTKSGLESSKWPDGVRVIGVAVALCTECPGRDLSCLGHRVCRVRGFGLGL